MTTYGHFWLGMEAGSKPGRGDPVSVRLWPSAPRFQAWRSPSDRNLGGFFFGRITKRGPIVDQFTCYPSLL